MTRRIFRSILLVAIAVLIAALIIILGVLYDYFSVMQRDQLRAETALAAEGVANEGTDYLKALEPMDTRLTWIAADGTVLYDSVMDEATMENHLEREEIVEALESGYGESSRYSSSLMGSQLYAAQRLDDGTVLRLAIPQNTVLNLIFGMLQPTAIVLAGAILLAFLLAKGVSRKIVKPLNELDLDNPPVNGEYEELAPLLKRILSQQYRLEKQQNELLRKQTEFNAATDGMSEGILLIGEQRRIVSINRAAALLLEAPDARVGLQTTVFDPSYDIENLLVAAEQHAHAEKQITKNNMDYRLNVTAIAQNGKTVGFALLIFDVTEKEKNEKMRREFTANVSHELKTPLHSISGCSELMLNGMVKPEDIPVFAGQIHAEAGRMIDLIEDIIRLSRLDEGACDDSAAEVDLYALAQDTLSELAPLAAEENISLHLEGESATLLGIPQMLSVILHNLVENAIKYNRVGGTVTVGIHKTQDRIDLSVKDNGIGIAREHHDRLFERFYRVDKSHSKEVGGTGLGLSIVKHAAQLHRAEITLESELGQGTEITVHFPYTADTPSPESLTRSAVSAP